MQLIAVVITRLDAEKPVDAMIRLMNSFDRSTLLCSSEPDSNRRRRRAFRGP